MTDEQILSIDTPGLWSYNDKHKIQFARAVLSAAIPEGCGVWREEECGCGDVKESDVSLTDEEILDIALTEEEIENIVKKYVQELGPDCDRPGVDGVTEFAAGMAIKDAISALRKKLGVGNE